MPFWLAEKLLSQSRALHGELRVQVRGNDLFDVAIERLMAARDYEKLMQLVVYSNDEERNRLIIKRIAEARSANGTG